MAVWPRTPIAVLAAASLVGCARDVPPQKPTAALYRDLERIVSVAETTGWKIDRIELRGLERNALLSVCRVPDERRAELEAWLDARIAALGGPVKKAWRQRGKDIGAVGELLQLTRIRMALDRARKQAPEDCPFWMEPSDEFDGRQISDDRWQVSLGGGGKGILVHQGNATDIHFGGAGRMLIGYTFGSLGLYTGAEAGATAAFPKDDMGERGNVVFGIDAVLPVVLRHTLVNGYWEVEAGPLGSANEDDREVIPGVHFGVSVGGRATRRRWFFPGAAFGVSYERTFPSADQGKAVTSIKVGFRVAIDVDL